MFGRKDSPAVQDFQSSNISTINFGEGFGGNVNIDTYSLFMDTGARINSTTLGRGLAGNINIIGNNINIVGISNNLDNTTQISSSADVPSPFFQEVFKLNEIPTGNSGDITINTDTLRLTNLGLINVRNDGLGNAGSLFIRSQDIILNSSAINAESESGQGGNIILNGHNLSLNNAQITATAGGLGDGGNIILNNNVTFLLNNSQITANAFEGQGGNIQLNTGVLFQDPSSQVIASSELGIDGTVDINADFDVLDSNISVLSLNLPTNSLEVKIGCEDIELIRVEQISAVNQGFVAVVKDSQLPANGLVYMDGKWVTGRYLTQQEFEALDCGEVSLTPHHPITPSPRHPVTPSSSPKPHWAPNLS